MNVSNISSFSAATPSNSSSRLDVDNSGRVTFNDLVRFKGEPLLEVAEPNTPQVDNFDVNHDGIVTTADIRNKFAQNSEASSRQDLGISAFGGRMDKIVAAISENREALTTLTRVEFGGDDQRLIDIIV
jgi:Ca2+-binding EF-hand superfamily protein